MIRVVAALLLCWEPLNFAAEALTVLPTITHRGWLPGAELAGHALVAAVAAAGGLALWNLTPDSARLATIAIVASFLRTVQSLYWSELPRNTFPGDEPVVLSVAAFTTLIAIVIIRNQPSRAGLRN